MCFLIVLKANLLQCWFVLWIGCTFGQGAASLQTFLKGLAIFLHSTLHVVLQNFALLLLAHGS